MTDSEFAAWEAEYTAKQEADRIAYEAAAPLRKAATAAKRADTLATKRTWIVKMHAAYPALEFTCGVDRGSLHITWIDGPTADTVRELLGCPYHAARRLYSPAAAARVNLERQFMPRLYKRRQRDVKIAKGIARLAAIVSIRTDARQLTLFG